MGRAMAMAETDICCVGGGHMFPGAGVEGAPK